MFQTMKSKQTKNVVNIHFSFQMIPENTPPIMRSLSNNILFIIMIIIIVKIVIIIRASYYIFCRRNKEWTSSEPLSF